ncbi:MAG: NAD-dependent epimerase/dehydratase family protein, partial [bacterium]
MKVLITGAGGLVGSEAARFYLKKGYKVFGVDNNMRAYFFGPGGDISGNLKALADLKADFKNFALDIRNSEAIFKLFKTHGPFDLIVHTAAQPSHDWAAREPLTDFGINATGTLNMLEGFRLYSSGGVFIFTSTNKVYGDTPNRANLEEGEKRYDFSPTQSLAGVSTRGISEKMSIDDSIHSGFGASKVAADIMAQEYGRYFNLNVGIFRGGCLTGP